MRQGGKLRSRAPGCAQRQQMELRDREWHRTAPRPDPGLERSCQVPALGGLSKVFLVTKKEREMFVSKRGWERAEPVGFCRKDGCSEAGIVVFGSRPHSHHRFHLQPCLHLSGKHHFPGNSGNCQANGLWSIPAPAPPLPLAAHRIPTILTAPAKAFKGQKCPSAL